VELSRPVALGGARHGRNTHEYAENWNGYPQVAPPYEPRPAASRAEIDVWTGTDWWTKPSAGTRPAPASTQPTYADRLPGGALPVRVPQASLAPQLRDQNRTRSAGRGVDMPLDSAEAARSSMSALQQGWERGRNVAGGPTAESDTGWR
jgi:hypothetical protein